MQDVIIIGGGAIGLSLAWELAEAGVRCAVLDQRSLGEESSWAGAGILPPGNPARAQTPEARLRAASHALWPALSERLWEETGIDNGFRRCGGLEVRLDGQAHELDAEVEQWSHEGVEAIQLGRSRLFECEAKLSSRISAAYRLPELGQVRNPRHLKGLLSACSRRGVKLLPGVAAWDFERSGARITAVETSMGRMPAGQFVIAAGAWSRRFLAQAGCTAAVRPLRGQIVLLALSPSVLSHVINVGPRYLVPRDDGRVLVGSTEEVAGFDKRATAMGIGSLIEFALGLVPELSEGTVERTWAGLRPQSLDGLPYIGPVPSTDNLFVAAGHFRAGLQLSPITARLMTQLLTKQPTDIPIAPYAADRRPSEFPPPRGC